MIAEVNMKTETLGPAVQRSGDSIKFWESRKGKSLTGMSLREQERKRISTYRLFLFLNKICWSVIG